MVEQAVTFTRIAYSALALEWPGDLCDLSLGAGSQGCGRKAGSCSTRPWRCAMTMRWCLLRCKEMLGEHVKQFKWMSE